MGEPRAITYKEVKKAVGEEGSSEMWRKIGEIADAGHVPTGIDGDGSIDLTSVSDSKRDRIDKLLAGDKEDVQVEDAKTVDTTKRGNK